MEVRITVVGGGLAGCEAAYQIARRGHKVVLYEMRPMKFTPAHKTPFLAELVCSNSLKSKEVTNAHGLLKEELRILESIVMKIADATAIPGGKALVVDREGFARCLTEEIEGNPNIEVIREEVREVLDGVVIIATGPLTSDGLALKIKEITDSDNLFFYDAISPIVDGETIDMASAFFGSRYMDDAEDYLNCPLTASEYELFYDALLKAERVSFRAFESYPYFEGCLPIEVMADRGKKTLLYGPMKPVGIIDRRTGRQPFAVVQLRREDSAGRMYNLVGFQTKLTYREQERVFRLIPALKDATFLRYGSIHRNTYINSPVLLNRFLQLRTRPEIYFAGQITGVEGYIESTSIGLLTGIYASLWLEGRQAIPVPEETSIGGLVSYITEAKENRRGLQPMNINFGLIKGYQRKAKEMVIKRAISSIEEWKKAIK